MTELLLGIDMGTGSTKGVLATPDGEIISTAVRPHSMSVPRPGWAEADPERDWWDDIVAICRELVPRAAGRRIAALCVSGVGPCLVICDAALRPLRPAILYGIDTRATEQVAELTELIGAERVLERCGKALSSQAVGPKMLWVQQQEPGTWERAAGWYNSNSFAVAKLTGEYVIDHHSASQFDPLYDIKALDWAHDWAAQVAPGIPLPALAWPTEIVGTVTAPAAAQTGLPAGTPVCAGTIDAWAEAFSVGVRRPGDLMLMYGSTMFFVQILGRFRSHPLLWTTAGVDPESHTIAAGMSTSGSLTTWIQELVGGVPFPDLVAEAAAVAPGSDGLLVLPYFSGERTPIFDPHARGVVAGLSLGHRRAHLFRAAYEGIAFGVRHIFELLEDNTDPATRLVAVGGGTQGGLWTQIVSDVTGREQLIPVHTVGASYGDALMAAIGAGLVPPHTDWARLDRRITPDPSVRTVYDQLYQAYRDLYPATREQVHVLSAIQASLRGAAPSPAGDLARHHQENP